MVNTFLALALLATPIGWDAGVDARRAVTVSDSFEAVALTWRAAAPVSLRVRASDDGMTWSEWITATLDDDVSVPSEGRFATAIIHFGAAKRFVEHEFTGDVRAPRITFFVDDRRPRLSGQAGRLSSTGTHIRSRSEWGCPDGQGSRWTPAYSKVTHAIVHHTAGSNSLDNWEAEVRNIWQFHTVTNGWGDIGYNFLIDPNGVVYEGRAGGDGAIGAHFSCRNTNTVGVALLGTFSTQAPTEAAMESLKSLLGELTQRHGIAPNEITAHVPSTLNMHGISAHRDGNLAYPITCTRTECPGDVLYGRLPDIRADLVCIGVLIDRHPQSTSIAAGGTTTLSVAARGDGPFTYQWFEGASRDTDKPIEGATAAELEVAPQTSTSYWVRITNRCSVVDSSAGIVSITIPGRRRVAKP